MTAAVNSGAFPVASGNQSYSGVFTPIIWSTKFITKFYTSTVFGAIANTDYEGEIKNQGDTIYIPLVPDMEIKDYEDGQVLEIDRPRGDNIAFEVKRGKYFNAQITDVQKHQASIPFLDKWSTEASERMKIKIDNELLGAVYADAHSANSGTTAGKISGNINLGTTGSGVQVTASNVIDELTKLTQVLDEQNVPQNPSDRYIVIPAWMARLIKRSELRDASITGDSSSPIRNGLLGTIDMFGEIYVSNNIPVVSDSGTNHWHVIAGHKSAITFASQMTKMETIRSERTFGDLMRGLQVYDFKVIKPEALVDYYVKQ